MAEVFVTAAEGAAGVKKLAVVKRLRTDLTKDEDPEAAEAAERFRSMFLAEAQLSARLNHANIVHTYEVGQEHDGLFIAMEYVEGQSLYQLQNRLLKQGKGVPTAMAVRILCEVLSGLHYAHELTDISGEKLVIVHRDVSPQNIMLTYDGGVKLVDFGVAKASYSSQATEVGTMKGKVRYMAPEQVAGSNVDRRADVFAAGVVLWELLAKKRLTRGSTDAQALLALVQEDAPSLLVEAPSVDPALAAVVMRALSRDPDKRYRTALEMRSALEAFLAQEHVTSEDIGQLVRTTFASEREAMMTRVREALTHSDQARDDVVVDWGTEGSIVGSGASRAASRSASRKISSPEARPSDKTLVEDDLSVPVSLGQPPSSRRRTPLWVPVVVLLAALGGAGIAVFAVKDRLGGGEPPVQSSLPPMADPVAAAPSIVAPAPAPAPATPSAEEVQAAPTADAATSGKAVADAKTVAKAPARSGAPAKSEGVEGAKKESTSVAPAAESEKGFVSLDTYPWTKVSVNGRSLGTTPLVKVALPAGTHTFVLENSEEKISERVTLTVKPGETTVKRLAF